MASRRDSQKLLNPPVDNTVVYKSQQNRFVVKKSNNGRDKSINKGGRAVANVNDSIDSGLRPDGVNQSIDDQEIAVDSHALDAEDEDLVQLGYNKNDESQQDLLPTPSMKNQNFSTLEREITGQKSGIDLMHSSVGPTNPYQTLTTQHSVQARKANKRD